MWNHSIESDYIAPVFDDFAPNNRINYHKHAGRARLFSLFKVWYLKKNTCWIQSYINLLIILVQAAKMHTTLHWNQNNGRGAAYTSE